LFELHLQHRQSRRLVELEALHAIQNHTVLIAATVSDPAVEIKSRATAHQHITAPDRRRRRSQAVHHRIGAVCWGDGEPGLPISQGTGPTPGRIWTDSSIDATSIEVLIFKDGRYDITN
jgi:hypothetical protein